VNERRPALKILSDNQAIIHREDSLQKLAALSPEERDAFVKKLLKQLRKEKGLKDIDASNPTFGNTLPGNCHSAADLFSSNTSEFYFLNNSLKARGSVEFKSRWGTRPNVDNWRRQSAVNNSLHPV
jgi:hypothetical protein